MAWQLKAFRVAGFSLLLLATSCATTLKMPEPAATSETEALRGWANVLRYDVDDKGRVNFQALREHPAPLNSFVGYVAVNGPESTPADYPASAAAKRLAYYLNAYNALSMYTVVEKNIPKTNSGLNKVGFFYLTKLKIDGRTQSLYTFENETIRKQGDPRVHFALNCMSVSCPRLPRTPFTEKDLNEELDREARFFFSEDRNLHVDEEKHIVWLSKILSFYKQDFLAQEPSLIAFVNRYAAKPVPENYEVKFYDYDWTINAQP